MNPTNETSCTTEKRQPCFDETVHIICLCLICILGVVSNTFLLLADYKEWKKRRTPDKVLICNVAIANAVGLLVSVPYRVIRLSQAQSGVVKCKRQVVKYEGVKADQTIAITCALVTVATLSVVGVDRLEALTKFAHQRKLTVKSSVIASVLIWVCSLVLIYLPLSRLFFYLMQLAIFILLVISCTVTVFSLLAATRRIRKHRQEIVKTFGSRHAQVEIKFTKTAIALCICHVVFMLQNLVSVLDTTGYRNGALRCTKVWINFFTHFNFTLLPVIYISMDKRMRRAILPKRRVLIQQAPLPTPAVNPPAISQKSQQTPLPADLIARRS